MPDIRHQLLIQAPPERVFPIFATPAGLDTWWTDTASGGSALGDTVQLGFTPEYQWAAQVTRCVPDTEFELRITEASEDWLETRVGVQLTPTADGGSTIVDFHHAGWGESSDHYRISSFCWATYLRLAKRHVEHGEFVPYGARDDA